ncbi:vitelline membrane outer layer protein 1 homolog [Eleutherodactylus coqui]|uniref:vitelline membrane outer layer protein 1 homolog n=1 Tax=Eleutherodactylus coqui TaxID=57060 RepID=UPI0034625D63
MVTFLQDNDPKTTAKTTQEELWDNFVNILEWPSQSPDLNPIQFLWRDRNMAVHRRFSSNQKNGRKSPNSSVNLVESYPRRLEALYIYGGVHIEQSLSFRLLEDKMLSKVLALLLFVQTAQVYSEVISVGNGGQQGEWGPWEKCPDGLVVRGFSLKMQQPVILGDDTAVDGIKLYCAKCKPPHDVTIITSAVAPWGNWTEPRWCKYGRPYKFEMRVEKDGDSKDDTSVNNIKFKCTDGGEVEGKGLYWGKYGDLSEGCKNGICGLRTRVQGNKKNENDKVPTSDNTGLNDVRFVCCD